MTKYVVYVKDIQTIEVEAKDEADAEEKVINMLDDGYVVDDDYRAYEYVVERA